MFGVPIALVSLVDASQSMVLQQRLDDAVQALNQREQRGYQVAYSVGAVTFDPSRHGDVAALLADSDGAMYQRKQARKVALREAVAVG
jgi:GGDEF domain-containing protein